MDNNKNICKNGIHRVMLMLAAAVAALLFTSLSSQDVQAASAKKKALAAYRQLLEEQDDQNKKFAVIYLDNNSVPELIFNNNLYTFRNSEIIQIDTGYLSPVESYYKKKGVLVHFYAHASIRSAFSTHSYVYSKLSGGKLVARLARYKYIDLSGGKVSWEYENQLKGKEITKSKFNSLLKKLVKSRKATKVRYRANTAANRKKYVK